MGYVFAMAIMLHLLLGASALSFARSTNFTVDFMENEGISCTGAKAEDCDIKTQARGDLRAKKSVRPLFVKFHKVGSTTLMELINAFMGVTVDCGRSCGECTCLDGARACTGHISKEVLVDYVLAAEQPAHDLFRSEEVSTQSQLIPMGERTKLFTKLYKAHFGSVTVNHDNGHVVFPLKDAPLKWIPKGNDKDAVVMITLLRNPLERMRSKYYFRRAENFCGKDCEAKKESFLKFMKHGGQDVCCEYVTTLGRGSVTRAKRVLATMFDVVGITEEMNDAFVDAAKLFGVPVDHLPKKITCRDNGESKQDWTSEELALAEQVAADDIEIYNFARDLKKKRRKGA